MTPSLRLTDESGRPLRLGQKLGEGGEGAVYRLVGSRSDVAVKVYNRPLTQQRSEKIRRLAAMSSPSIHRVAAWPFGLILDESRRPRGLLLPVVEGSHDIHQLYSPKARKMLYPRADWRFLIHVATNVSRAFAAVHSLNLVIGDVNHGSVLVGSDGTVRLIDVDSFQVPTEQGPLLCTVAVPMFLAPELHGVPLQTTVRTANHDAFGLAVLIFQLLLLGRHPYAGRYAGKEDMPIERAIREYRFAFSRDSQRFGMSPPPNAVDMSVLPPSTRELFEHSFSRSAPTNGRPTAARWVAELRRLGEELAHCRKETSHYFWGRLPGCPWCTFEGQTTVLLFSGGVKTQNSSELQRQFRELLDKSSRVAAPLPSSPQRRKLQRTPQPQAIAAGVVSPWWWFCYVLAMVAAVLGLVLAPIGLLLLAAGVGVLLSGLVARQRRVQPWVEAYRSIAKDAAAANSAMATANTFPRFHGHLKRIGELRSEWDSLDQVHSRKLQELHSNKRGEQLRAYLESQLIANARIEGVGPSREAMLAAYGIESAADVVSWRVTQVPQFGPVMTQRMLAWRNAVEARFVYDSRRGVPSSAIAQLDKWRSDQRRRVLDELRRQVSALERARVMDAQDAAAAARRVDEISIRLWQAEADVTSALGRLPKVD